MKLSEYFQQQKSQVMTSRMKSHLFSRIQKEKTLWSEVSVKLPSKIFFFASRKIMYASLAVVLVFVVFWWLLLDKNDIIDFGIFSVQKHVNPGWVLADYVAEVVEFNWDCSLQRDGVTIPNFQDLKLIEDGDTITLSEWTDLLFNLTDWTQSKIVWPAEFSITKWEEWYKISIVDGKFFRIYCPECVSDIEIVTPDVSIHQEKNQVLDVHIAKEPSWEMIVKNDWDAVVVTTKKDEAPKETELVSSELVAITPDSEKIIISSDSDLMSAFMAKNNISATFTLSTDNVDWPTIQPKQPTDILAMNTEKDNTVVTWEVALVDKTPTVDAIEESNPLLEWVIDIFSSDLTVTEEIDENVAAQLWLSSEDEQKVPATDQMQSLKTNLNSFFLMSLFENIYNGDKVDQNISKFADRINAVAKSFGYPDRTSSDLTDIKNTILTLKDKLEKDWYVSPSYILQMEKVARWCDELKNPSQPDWESLSSNLPINLRLM